MRTLLPATLSLCTLLLASPSGPCGPSEADLAPRIEALPPALPAVDCNGNGVEDAVDIALGESADGNLDGIPDECQSRPAGPAGAR